MKFKQYILESNLKESITVLDEASLVFDKLKQIHGATSNIDIDSTKQLLKDSKEYLSSTLKDLKLSDFKTTGTQLMTKIEITVKSLLGFKHAIGTTFLDDAITSLYKLKETIKQYSLVQVKNYDRAF